MSDLSNVTKDMNLLERRILANVKYVQENKDSALFKWFVPGKRVSVESDYKKYVSLVHTSIKAYQALGFLADSTLYSATIVHLNKCLSNITTCVESIGVVSNKQDEEEIDRLM